jgi:hypothetical protein
MGTSFKNLPSTFARYKDVASWLLHDAYWRFRPTFLTALFLSGASLTVQFAALGVIYKYLQDNQGGELVSIRGHTFEPQSSPTLLAIAAGTVLVLFGGGIILGYWGRVRALALGRAYEEFCSRRAIALVNGRTGTSFGPGERLAIHGDPRSCGRVARILIEAVLPALFVIVSTVVLIVLEPMVTFWLGLLVLAAGPFLYLVSVRAAGFSQRMERTAGPAAAAKRAFIRTDCGPRDAEDHQLKEAFRSGPLAENLNAYVGRRRAVEESRLITGLLMATALALILGQQGAQILTSGQGLSSLAVYLITLRLQLGNLSKVMRVLTSVNRFYPQIARHRRFLLGIPNPSDEAKLLPDDDDDLDEDM